MSIRPMCPCTVPPCTLIGGTCSFGAQVEQRLGADDFSLSRALCPEGNNNDPLLRQASFHTLTPKVKR